MSLNGEARKKEKLDPLPDPKDKDFWLDAEIDNHEAKQMSCKSKHEFRNGKKANEAKCMNCPVGYILPVGSEIRNRHIYHNDELII